MVKVRLRYVKAIRKNGGRKGNRVLYYWIRPGHDIRRMPDDPGASDFITLANQLNAEADEADGETKAEHGSVSYCLRKYEASPEFLRLAPTTKKEYRHWIRWLDTKYGKLPIIGLTRRVVLAMRQMLIDKPHRCNSMLRFVRLFLSWCMDNGYIQSNPALGPKTLSIAPRQAIWSQADETTFLAVCGPELAAAYILAIETVQRQADLLALTWNQYDGETIQIRQRKTRRMVSIPVSDRLKSALAKIDRRAVQILTDESGRAWDKYAFGREWRIACDRAGLSHLQFRDLRRTGMVRMARAGATAIEVCALSGHAIDQGQRILETYIPRDAEMARAAIHKLDAKKRASVNG